MYVCALVYNLLVYQPVTFKEVGYNAHTHTHTHNGVSESGTSRPFVVAL